MREMQDYSEVERANEKKKAISTLKWSPLSVVMAVILIVMALIVFLTRDVTDFLSLMWVLMGLFVIINAAFRYNSAKTMLARIEAYENSQQTYPQTQVQPAQYQNVQQPQASVAAPNKFCPFCGTENPGDYIYCGKCRNKLP